MAIADSKKVQTMINVLADEAEIIQASIARMKSVRDRFNTANPVTDRTILDSNLTNINNGITALDTEVSKQLWTDLIDNRVSTHRSKSL